MVLARVWARITLRHSRQMYKLITLVTFKMLLALDTGITYLVIYRNISSGTFKKKNHWWIDWNPLLETHSFRVPASSVPSLLLSLLWPHLFRKILLDQQSSTFLAPGTSLVKDNFSIEGGGREDTHWPGHKQEMSSCLRHHQGLMVLPV